MVCTWWCVSRQRRIFWSNEYKYLGQQKISVTSCCQQLPLFPLIREKREVKIFAVFSFMFYVRRIKCQCTFWMWEGDCHDFQLWFKIEETVHCGNADIELSTILACPLLLLGLCCCSENDPYTSWCNSS